MARNNHIHQIMTGLSVILIMSGVFISLLQHFVLTLPKNTEAPLWADGPVGDGIVVTTGGQARLQEGVRLLAQEAAPLLLVSGVGKGITKDMIAQSLVLTEAERALLSCCVTLEFQALDTLGNAVAARQWAQTHDIARLLLVTSDYHMPRAALEFTSAMPHMTIIAYPIVAPDLATKSWYSDWQTMRLYAREFLKYSFARLRLAV